MEHFNSDLTEAGTHAVNTETSQAIVKAISSFQENNEETFFELGLGFNDNNVTLLGTDRFNTPFFIDNNISYSTTLDQNGRPSAISNGMAAARSRESYTRQAADRTHYEGKSLLIFLGFHGSDLLINYAEPIIGPDDVPLLNVIPSLYDGFPIYVDMEGEEQLYVGTLYNVGSKHRSYLHHSSMHIGPNEGNVTDNNRFSRRKEIEFDLFAAAIDKVAWVTSQIEDQKLNPRTFMEMCGVERMPGLGNTIDVLAGRRNTIRGELESAETNLQDLQTRAMESASQLVSLRLLSEEMQSSTAGILDVSTIKHPLIKDIFVRQGAGTSSTVYIDTHEVFFKPSSNPDGYEYDEDGGISCGHFLMSITLEQCRDPIKFINKDYRIVAFDGQAMNHPHVFHGGNACLGSFGGSITSALADGSLESVIDMAFMFLQQANQDDSAGRFWNRWLDPSNEEFAADAIETI